MKTIKKLPGYIISIMLLCVLALTITVSALATTAVTNKNITVTYSNIGLNVDGNAVLPTDANGNRIDPFTYNGITYLPLRAVADLVDKDVAWDAASKIVSLTDKTSISATNIDISTVLSPGKIGSKTIVVAYLGIKVNVNGNFVDAGNPFVYNGTVYLPVRAIGTALGKTVSYDSNKKIVYITNNTGAALEVHFIDVGQGDAIFIELPDDETMLIDAGNAENGSQIVNYIKKQGHNTIDYLIATHPHADHIGGMEYVVNNLNIKSVYMPKVQTTTQTYQDLLLAIKNRGLNIKTAKSGVNIIKAGNLAVDIIAPNNDYYDELNNYSAVIKLSYGTNTFLFMGDAQVELENEITTDIKADVLKVGHHGSDTSTGKAFLNKVAPKYAVISVGADNDYGHPEETTLDKLKAINAIIYRTDKDGTVVFTSNGTKITVNKVAYTISTNNTSSATQTTNTVSKSVAIAKADKVGEIVTIKNTGSSSIDLTGWVLVSVTGNQRYTFPSYILKANSTVTVASGGASGNLIWISSNIWNNSISDPAKLYDAQGNLVSTFYD